MDSRMHPSHNQHHHVYEEYYSHEMESPSLMQQQYPQRYSTATTAIPAPALHSQTSSSPQQSFASSSTTNQNQQPKTTSEAIELGCDEKIGPCKSPAEFPEYVPGAWDEIRQHKAITPGKSAMRFRTELDSGDVKLVNELGQLTVDNLLDYMKNLQNNAFLLGEEEAKEFQRAKCLGIFQK